MDTVTRQGIGHYLRGAFEGEGATRDELVETAKRNGAEDVVLAVLERLTRPHYSELRQLWVDLYDVPVGEPVALSEAGAG